MSTGENWWQSASGRWSCNYRYHPFKFALCLDTITPHCCLNLRYPFPITYKCHVFEANMPFSNPFNCFKICSELSQLQTKFLSSWKMTSESWEGEMLNNMNNLKFEFKVSFEHLIKNVLTQQSSVHRTIFRQSNCWKLINNNWQHGTLFKFCFNYVTNPSNEPPSQNNYNNYVCELTDKCLLLCHHPIWKYDVGVIVHKRLMVKHQTFSSGFCLFSEQSSNLFHYNWGFNYYCVS